MSRNLTKLVPCLMVLSTVLLTTGCSKTDKDKYGSTAYHYQANVVAVDSFKACLVNKNTYELQSGVAILSDILKTLPDSATSAGAKAKAQKASEMFEAEMRPVLLSAQYDPAAMGKKLDEIRAVVIEVGKEVK